MHIRTTHAQKIYLSMGRFWSCFFCVSSSTYCSSTCRVFCNVIANLSSCLCLSRMTWRRYATPVSIGKLYKTAWFIRTALQSWKNWSAPLYANCEGGINNAMHHALGWRSYWGSPQWCCGLYACLRTLLESHLCRDSFKLTWAASSIPLKWVPRVGLGVRGGSRPA